MIQTRLTFYSMFYQHGQYKRLTSNVTIVNVVKKKQNKVELKESSVTS